MSDHDCETKLCHCGKLLSSLEKHLSEDMLVELWFDNPDLVVCWQVRKCNQKRCPVYGRQEKRCWHVIETHCDSALGALKATSFSEKWKICKKCPVWKKATQNNFTYFREIVNNIIFLLINQEKDHLTFLKRVDDNFNAIMFHYKLTPREGEVLHHILLDKNRNEIATALNISIETIKMHKRNLYKKFTVCNKAGIKQHLQNFIVNQQTGKVRESLL